MQHQIISLRALVCALSFWTVTLRAQSSDHNHNHGTTPAGLPNAIQPRGSVEAMPAKLPKLPKGVEELKFGDFFVRPVGPRGLEWTETVRALDGRKVRILGYMVQEETPMAGQFMLAPLPMQVHSHDNSLADDLPPSTLHVISPAHDGQPVPFTPQLLLLTGVLELGNRAESGGRISIARLTLGRESQPKRKPANGAPPSGKGGASVLKAK